MAVFPDVVTSVPAINPEQVRQRFKTLVSPLWGGREQRKAKQLFPLRDVSLRYQSISVAQAKTLWQFHLDRKGKLETFVYFADARNADGTYLEWQQEYVGTGDGSTTAFDCPSKGAASESVYIDTAVQTPGSNYTLTQHGGADGADRLSFTVAPPLGSIITMTFTGRLKIYCRFAEDYLEFEIFYRRLVNSGVQLVGLPNA